MIRRSLCLSGIDHFWRWTVVRILGGYGKKIVPFAHSWWLKDNVGDVEIVGNHHQI
jgi:hypothetical protein